MATNVAEFRLTFPMVEPLALPAYAVLALGILASAVLVPVAGFAIVPTVWPILLLWPFVAVCGMLLRRIGHAKLAAAMEATALVYGQGLAFLLALFPLTALGAPLADQRLAAIDQSLGFNWTAYAWAISPFIDPLVIAYKSFNWQPLLIVLALAFTQRDERLWRFVTAGALSLLIAVAVYPLAPALGAFVHHGLTGYPMKGDGPRAFGQVIEAIRGGDHVIRPVMFTGFVSFPSYHAAAALLFVWAAWPMRWLRVVLIPLNIALVAGAVVVGGHYFIDIIAGLIVGATSLYLSGRALR